MREAAIALCPGAEAVACGSYRRGKKDCGDVDVLVTHPDGRSHKGLFTLLLQRLRDTGIGCHVLFIVINNYYVYNRVYY